MPKLGYSLSSEEFDAPTLVAQAERAERAGFAFAGISDHFHPWIDAQGESPFWEGELTSHRGEHYRAEDEANVYVHRVGDDQEGFFRFYEHEILPHFG